MPSFKNAEQAVAAGAVPIATEADIQLLLNSWVIMDALVSLIGRPDPNMEKLLVMALKRTRTFLDAIGR